MLTRRTVWLYDEAFPADHLQLRTRKPKNRTAGSIPHRVGVYLLANSLIMNLARNDRH